MDGLEAAAAIREKEGTDGGHVPIIAMTAHAVKGFRERCLEAGMDDYITKPIDPEELFRAVETAVDCEAELAVVEMGQAFVESQVEGCK